MRLDLVDVETRLRVGQEPPDEVLGLPREMDVVREVKVCPEVEVRGGQRRARSDTQQEVRTYGSSSR